MTVTTDQLVAVGEAAGLTSVGVTEASPFRESRAELEERDRLGMRADLGFTYKDPDRSTDVTTSFPGPGLWWWRDDRISPSLVHPEIPSRERG